MRLIDADALKEKISEAHFKTYGNAMKCIMEAPTVDAVPVVHGRCDWCNGEHHTKIMATAIRYHSNGNMDGYEMKVNYCPHCGAKMDGGHEDA